MNYNVFSLFPTYVAAKKFNLNLFEIDRHIHHIFNKDFRKGVVKSNRGGWQSPSYNLGELSFFDNYVFPKITEFVNAFLKDICIKGSAKLGNYWINLNFPNTYNVMHDHPSSAIAGSFYIRVPLNSGEIKFENSDCGKISSYLLNANGYSKIDFDTSFQSNPFVSNYSDTFNFMPEANLALLFPAWQRHYVELNRSNLVRISIAFNYSII